MNIIFVFTEAETVGVDHCDCQVPCTKNQFDPTLSSSLLDAYKIKDDVISQLKSVELLPKYQEALEISAQVHLRTLEFFQFI